MKLNVKRMLAKSMTMGVAAVALAMAAPKQAEAQRFAVGVQVAFPGYPAYGYYPRDRYEFRRHEEWVRAHEYARYHHGYWYR